MSEAGWRGFLAAEGVGDRAVLHGGATAVFRAVLGCVPMAEDNAVDPLGHGSTVFMQALSETESLRHAMHVDVPDSAHHRSSW